MKKLSIIYIWEILKKHSDADHLLTHAKIVEMLKAIYGLEVERKSVSENIKALSDHGIEIRQEKKGCYLIGREFDIGQVRFLIDAVFSSKNISSREAKDLAERLSEFSSEHEKKRYKYLYKADQISRTTNRDLFVNIDTINEAIEKGKRIEFQYHEYGADGKLKLRNDGKVYNVSPYVILNNNGKNYLVCSDNLHGEGFANYRLEFMTNIKVTPKDLTPKKIDIAQYANENVYMFGRDVIDAIIKLEPNGISPAIDWFGKNVTVRPQPDGSALAYITAVEMAVIYWAMQYSQAVEIIEPKETREKIKEMIKGMNKKYGIT